MHLAHSRSIWEYLIYFKNNYLAPLRGFKSRQYIQNMFSPVYCLQAVATETEFCHQKLLYLTSLYRYWVSGPTFDPRLLQSWSRSTAWLEAHPRIFRIFIEGEIRLCTVVFGQKSPKLNSNSRQQMEINEPTDQDFN